MAGHGRPAGAWADRPPRLREGTMTKKPSVGPVAPVAGLNPAVLYGRDPQRAADFYRRVFGFEVVASEFGGQAVFMRAAGGDNHHDLGLFSVGEAAPRAPRGAT